MSKDDFSQGTIWLVRLDPTEGSKIKKTRPCLVFSRSKINQKLNTVTVIPISSGLKGKSILRIDIHKNTDNGLEKGSHLILPQIRTVSKRRCLQKIGKVDSKIIEKVKYSMKFYF